MAQLRNTTVNDTGFLQLPVGTTAQRPGSPNAQQIRFNTDTGQLEQFRPSLGAWIAPSNTGVIATGGDAVYDVDVEGTAYRVHVFTTIGAATFEVLQGGEVEYLIVAGGGSGGGRLGGGGGAGGLLTGNVIASNQTYNINVGSGGSNSGQTGSSPSAPTSINDGDNSEAFGLTAIGGGAGGSYNSGLARDGGSGGGAHTYIISTGGTGLQPSSASGGSGNDGGDSTGDYAGGGGGGAGAPGGDGQANGADVGGVGGNGLASFLTGTAVFYAGGGGGGSWASAGSTLGKPGLGGGGTGAGDVDDGAATAIGEPGLVNTGGGGGGAGYDGNDWLSAGAGGSGIVVIRYPLRQENPVQAAGNKTQKNLFYEFDFAKPTVFQQGDTVVRDSRLFEQPTSSISGSPQYLDPRTHRSHLSFNPGGGSERVNTPFLVNEFPINSTYALEVWLKITNYPQPLSSPNQYGNTRIAGFVFGAASYGGLGIEYNGNDSGNYCGVRSYIRTTGGSRITSEYSMPLNTWTHLVLVRDSDLQLYVDGELFASTSVASGDYNRISSAGAMRFPNIGISGGGVLNYRYLQDSQYAIVRTYKTALTADEVSQNYNADRWRFGV